MQRVLTLAPLFVAVVCLMAVPTFSQSPGTSTPAAPAAPANPSPQPVEYHYHYHYHYHADGVVDVSQLQRESL